MSPSPPVPAAPGRRRRGVSGLLLALGLVAFLSLLGAFQHNLSRRTVGEVHRVQVAALARLQAESAVQELWDQAARSINQPGTPLFRALRQLAAADWSEVDVSSAFTAPSQGLEAGWGKLAAGAAAEGRVASEVVSFRARVRSPRLSFGTERREEWVALLTLTAVSRVADAALSLKREAEESFEIRMVRAGMPRPFDEVAFFLGNAEALVDVSRVNQRRQEMIALQDQLVNQMLNNPPSNIDPADAPRLQAILEAMHSRGTLEERTPELTTEPSALVGFGHVHDVRVDYLDLARLLDADATSIRQQMGSLGGSSDFIKDLSYLVNDLSMGVTRIYNWTRILTMLPEGGDQYQNLVAPFLDRLSPEYFLDRVTLRGEPEHPRIKAWLAGEARIDGVIDMRASPTQLQLTGKLNGRTVILVGPAGASLFNLSQLEASDSILVVSMGGDLQLSGTVDASVLVTYREGGGPADSGGLTMGLGTQFIGSLILPHLSPSQLELSGVLEQVNTRAPQDPTTAASWNRRGPYVAVLSPEALFAEGRAR